MRLTATTLAALALAGGFLFARAGCTREKARVENKAAAANSNTGKQSPAGATANSEDVKAAAEAKQPEPLRPPAQPEGVYAITEVEHDGVVDMVNEANTASITFFPSGNYTRTSKRNGRVDHTDSGTFRIEPPDSLTLSITMSGSKIQVPPVEKHHAFSLSGDGSELRLISDDGKVAVFRRLGAAAKK
jgi:hypothetical protein